MSVKFIIEIEDEPFVRKSVLHGEQALYRAVGFKSLVFDEDGLSKLKPYYHENSYIREAVGSSQILTKLFSYSPNELKEIFNEDNVGKIIDQYDAHTIKKWTNEYEESKRYTFASGDKVIDDDGTIYTILDKIPGFYLYHVSSENGFELLTRQHIDARKIRKI